jgi:RND family efflux transporter MFP subunit
METIKMLVRAGLPAVLFLMGVMSGCRSSATQEKHVQGVSPLPVEVMRVERRILQIPLRETGQLTAKSQVKLSFKTGGIIARVTVDDGATVKKGDLLASLDLSEIEAHVEEARLAYRKALRDYRRVYNLYRDSVATLEQLEHIRTARDIAYNNLRIARFNLKHSVIRAPADGKILRRLAESGEMIAPGYPVLLFASTDKAWVVRCHVPDRDIVRIGPADSAVVHFDAWPGRRFSGAVTATGTAADPYTNTWEVEITLDPSDLQLVTGLIANVTIWPSAGEEAVILPYRALRGGERMQGEVWLVRHGKAVLTEVEIAQMLDSLLVLRSGLQPGDTVVTDGLEDLVPGAPVKIISWINP